MSEVVSGEKNPNYGHRWTEEQRRKASERLIKSGRLLKENNPKAKKIICIETLEVFSYIGKASEQYGISESSISRAIKNKVYFAGKYHFAIYSKELYQYLLKNQFEYLCECYAELKNGKYYADMNNKVFYKKYELKNKLIQETEYAPNYIDKILKQNNFEINNVQYKLLNSRLTQ